MGKLSSGVQKRTRGGKPRLIIDFRYRDKDGREIALLAPDAARATGWNRLAVTRRGTKLTTKFNDVIVEELVVPSGPLTPGLVAGNVAVDCASLFVK